ncbi:OmpA family protein [Bradyrhizobium sp. U87765 SZCCT0131]|uniref:OmpA family protein n=1 Tax=unclassified Bradyrhizobium TaxID=2631580 RepID=UPI001BA728AF|nr:MULTISPECIES: OmpA family protein [unclassified Bradyrhizobium]MBR1221865.1 OmpA family protein [Bradyrhizobium sp. U87765 SZCCT0131]MBR1263937.1 OmpA family protein [Bradyrhizobium sp. U87765 SZCCT0134]MBR1302493.1 OmpA family protein [Bradyrhizobium sp. U87765 SZCCT0110]MBR1320187.1 OmpA family protein [Bradyrhizobium sp. U87765 SZCCT0109]MBR1348700.1 OmpA family protein [Bradyrhizobium sp. U87765 SZCCT0048]
MVFAAWSLVLEADAAVDVQQELNKHQIVRDLLFRNVKAATTAYTFEYLVINLQPGMVPGVGVSVPVSHIRFQSTVFFKFDKFSLEPGAEAPIQDFAKAVLSDSHIRSVLVVGHTDSIGDDQYNAALSLKRAVSVASKLREIGVSEKLLGVVPMGEAQPFATNSTPTGRAKNRRVEFFISDIPAATRKAIELVKFDPCHRNDHDLPPGQPNPECGGAAARVPLYPGASGLGRPETLDLSRGGLVAREPATRSPLPNETLQRPSLKQFDTN